MTEYGDMAATPELMTAKLIADAATATAKAVSEAATAAAAVIAKENLTVFTEIAVLKNEMTTIKTNQACFEIEINKKMDGLDPKFARIIEKLDELTLGRPTWSVALILGSLFSLCVGLIVFVITKI
jgi:hypothetical protein